MRTRFAPSPTGPLHLGHAFSALTAARLARALGGEFVLRIEDIDRGRSRPAYEAAIYEDLSWLGLAWPEPVMRQSERLAAHGAALDQLWKAGLLYPCTCSRREIAAALGAPHGGVAGAGPDGPVYPGTCRPAPGWRARGPRPAATLRLRMDAAVAAMANAIRFAETDAAGTPSGSAEMPATALPGWAGDIVLARRDMGTSYHLGVVVDDAAQGISHVVRGEDLRPATFLHRLLQDLLALPAPAYHHHRLIRDAAGRRLAKRDDARAIAAYRAEGVTPAALRARLSLPAAP